VQTLEYAEQFAGVFHVETYAIVAHMDDVGAVARFGGDPDHRRVAPRVSILETARPQVPWLPRWAQAVVRFSTSANNSYMAMAITPITIRPEKASGIFMAEPADTSR